MVKKVYVGNISFRATEDDIRELFSRSGEVESINVITDAQTGKPKGFAFVEMSNETEARQAIAVRAVDGGERASDEHLAIGLHDDSTDTGVYARARIETAVQTAIGIETGNVVAVRAVDGGELPADQHLAVGLHRDGVHKGIGA